MRAQKNYQKMLEATIAGLKEQNRVPTLLLHSCCAPCSSYCLEYLSQYFHITVDYYNPNIYPEEEYHMRVQEQQRLIRELPAKYPIAFREGAYDKERFYERCFRCYELRLREAAETAKSLGMDYFTTTLSISPLKNAEKFNEIGDALAEEYGIAYLNSDFKKKNGYKRSVELSEQYGMYRQYYCGCVFSKRERDAQIAAKAAAQGI